MPTSLDPVTRRRLDIQGLERVADAGLAPVARWLRLSYGLCAALAVLGTVLGSPAILLALGAVAAVGASQSVHPFDLLYNLGLRRFTGTGPLPRRGAPTRFACGLAAVWSLAAAWAFQAGHRALGYALGGSMSALATLVSTTDICVPSLIYRTIFGFPSPRGEGCPR